MQSQSIGRKDPQRSESGNPAAASGAKLAPHPEVPAPLPREHGAWGLLLQPFVAAAILARYWNWLLIPALALVVLGFILKEPLIVLARQRWVWRIRNPQSAIAKRWMVYELVGVAAALALLYPFAPLSGLAALASVALLLTALAVWSTVRNRQRSVALQILSAAGLSTSALLVALLARRGIPLWAWQLWFVLTLHAAGSILVVHARLRLKISMKGGQLKETGFRTSPRLAAILAQATQVVAAAAFIWQGATLLAIPLLLSAFFGLLELHRLRNPAILEEPLKRVGYRALAVSITHAFILVAVLWGAARAPVGTPDAPSPLTLYRNNLDFLTRISAACDTSHGSVPGFAAILPMTIPPAVKESS